MLKRTITIQSGFILILFLLLPLGIFAQTENSTDIKPSPKHYNSFNLTLAIPIVGYGIGFSYERILVKTNQNVDGLGIRIGYASMNAYWGKYSYFNPQLVMILGNGKHHLETCLGVAIINNQEDNISFNLGYKFKKSTESGIFRMGIGWPEILYVGIGFGF